MSNPMGISHRRAGVVARSAGPELPKDFLAEAGSGGGSGGGGGGNGETTCRRKTIHDRLEELRHDATKVLMNAKDVQSVLFSFEQVDPEPKPVACDTMEDYLHTTAMLLEEAMEVQTRTIQEIKDVLGEVSL